MIRTCVGFPSVRSVIAHLPYTYIHNTDRSERGAPYRIFRFIQYFAQLPLDNVIAHISLPNALDGEFQFDQFQVMLIIGRYVLVIRMTTMMIYDVYV